MLCSCRRWVLVHFMLYMSYYNHLVPFMSNNLWTHPFTTIWQAICACCIPSTMWVIVQFMLSWLAHNYVILVISKNLLQVLQAIYVNAGSDLFNLLHGMNILLDSLVQIHGYLGCYLPCNCLVAKTLLHTFHYFISLPFFVCFFHYQWPPLTSRPHVSNTDQQAFLSPHNLCSVLPMLANLCQMTHNLTVLTGHHLWCHHWKLDFHQQPPHHFNRTPIHLSS